MKRTSQLLFLPLIFILLLTFISCEGGSSEQIQLPPDQTTTVDDITITGTLNSGVLSGPPPSGFVSAPVPSYDVVAIDNETGEPYFGSTNAGGEFSIDLPKDGSYQISMLNESSNYAGPMVMKDGATSSEVIMGFEPTENFDFGTITIDSSAGMARPETEPTIVDNNITAAADGGVPAGAGNNGAGATTEGLGTQTGCDVDKDGIPDYFDSDDDGDGYLNGIIEESLTHSAATAFSNNISAVFLMMNLWAEYENQFLPSEFEDKLHMRITVEPKTGMTKTIDYVQCENPLGTAGAPSDLATYATIWNASSLGSVSADATYSSLEGLPWSSDGYKLYETDSNNDGTNDQWVVLLIPKTENLVGRVFKIMVYFTDGTSEGPFPIHIPWVLGNVARVTEVEDIDDGNGSIAIATAISNGLGSISSPAELSNFTGSTTTLRVTWQKPTNPDGTVIAGLSHSIGIKCVQIGGGIGGNLKEEEIRDTSGRITDHGSTLSIDLSVGTGPTDDLPDTYSSIEVDKYYLVPIAETADGQRNGEELWLDDPRE